VELEFYWTSLIPKIYLDIVNKYCKIHKEEHMIKGIIFDFDGLIFDTETHQYHLLQELYAEHSCELPLELWQKEIGTHTDFSPYVYLEEQAKKKLDLAGIEKAFKENFLKKLALEQERPGVRDYLETAKSLGLKIGLASSSNYEWVSSHLKRLGLFDYFDCIKTSDDVEKVKPDPALYIEAARCLELEPNECIAFEDSAHGAQAAKTAGLNIVIFPNEVTNAMQFCEVDYRFDSMLAMPLSELINKYK
jgi:HAD superfamily hydrolase (TIGR01509 family)